MINIFFLILKKYIGILKYNDIIYWLSTIISLLIVRLYIFSWYKDSK